MIDLDPIILMNRERHRHVKNIKNIIKYAALVLAGVATAMILVDTIVRALNTPDIKDDDCPYDDNEEY